MIKECEDITVVIMAGGKGTRIRGINDELPKPMLPLCDKPIIQHQIETLKREGIKKIVISVGHLKEKIINYFESNDFGDMEISILEENVPLGTAGCLKKISIDTDYVLLVNGDIIFDFDLRRFVDFHKSKNAEISLFTHPNNHPFDSAIIKTNKSKRIINWYNKEDERGIYKNRVNAGIHLFNSKTLEVLLEKYYEGTKIDLDRDILKPNLVNTRVYAYDSPEYVKDMGTPERYKRVEHDLKLGIVKRKNLSNKQKAIFLDRDGTINVYKGFITDESEIEITKSVVEAIKRINQSEYICLVVTNQPVIARGECTEEKLECIHNKMEMILGDDGAYIDDLLYCPHHPEKGFDGEVIELKVDCLCRKPKPGMLLEFAEKYNIDLRESYMIGDDDRDISAGINAGCTPILISKNEKSYKRDCLVVKDLYEAITTILQEH